MSLYWTLLGCCYGLLAVLLAFTVRARRAVERGIARTNAIALRAATLQDALTAAELETARHICLNQALITTCGRFGIGIAIDPTPDGGLTVTAFAQDPEIDDDPQPGETRH
jgi:hypothetical protein